MGSRHVVENWSEERYPEPFAANIATTAASGSQASVTQIGSTNIYLVVRDATFSLTPAAVGGVGLIGTTAVLNVIDGNSGGASLLWTGSVTVTSTGIVPITVRLDRPSRVVGGNVTAEFASGVTGGIESVSMGYFTSK